MRSVDTVREGWEDNTFMCADGVSGRAEEVIHPQRV